MKNGVTYILWILSIAFILCTYSCGARKSAVNKSQEQTESSTVDNSSTTATIDTNVKTTTTVKVDDKNQTVTEETTIEPSDNTKESFVIEKDGSKVILNNVKKIVRKTTQNNNTQTQSFRSSEQVKKEATHEQKAIKAEQVSKKEIKSKETKKEATPWYYWLLLLVPFIFLFAVCKRYGIF